MTAALLTAALLLAQPIEYTRVLLPVIVREEPGAFGSVWSAQTWVHYSGDDESFMTPNIFCPAIMCRGADSVHPLLSRRAGRAGRSGHSRGRDEHRHDPPARRPDRCRVPELEGARAIWIEMPPSRSHL